MRKMIKRSGRCKMNDIRFEVDKKIVGIRRVLEKNKDFIRMEEKFRLLIERRREEMEDDI